MNNNKHDKEKVKICMWVNLFEKKGFPKNSDYRPKKMNLHWFKSTKKQKFFGVENSDTTSCLKKTSIMMFHWSHYWFEWWLKTHMELTWILKPDSKESTKCRNFRQLLMFTEQFVHGIVVVPMSMTLTFFNQKDWKGVHESSLQLINDIHLK